MLFIIHNLFSRSCFVLKNYRYAAKLHAQCNSKYIQRINYHRNAMNSFQMRFHSNIRNGNDSSSNSISDTTSESTNMNTNMSVFMKLEIRLAMKKRAQELMNNKQSNSDSNATLNLDLIDKPSEPNEEECCGLDCANCVWIEYAYKMMQYQAQEDDRNKL